MIACLNCGVTMISTRCTQKSKPIIADNGGRKMVLTTLNDLFLSFHEIYTASMLAGFSDEQSMAMVMQLWAHQIEMSYKNIQQEEE